MKCKLKKIFIILISFYLFLSATNFDDVVYSKINSVKNDIKGVKERLNLDEYKVKIEAKKINEIKKNLSGITFNKNTNTLFAITNSPRNIYELTLNGGDVLRVIDLKGFKDTEGIVYLKDNLYAVIDERKSKVSLIKIYKDTKRIQKQESTKIFSLKLNKYKNFGYEGVAYDEKKDTLYVANEKFPIELIKASDFLKNKGLNISFGEGLTTLNHFMYDFSGLHFDNNTRHLLFFKSRI